jgi:hypothetical protein
MKCQRFYNYGVAVAEGDAVVVAVALGDADVVALGDAVELVFLTQDDKNDESSLVYILLYAAPTIYPTIPPKTNANITNATCPKWLDGSFPSINPS